MFALDAFSVAAELLTIELMDHACGCDFVKNGILDTIGAKIKFSGFETSIVHFQTAIGLMETERRPARGANEPVLILTAVRNGVAWNTFAIGTEFEIISTGNAERFGFEALFASGEAVFGDWADGVEQSEE